MSGYVTREVFFRIIQQFGFPVTEVLLHGLADNFSYVHDKDMISYSEFLDFSKSIVSHGDPAFAPRDYRYAYEIK